MSPTLVFAAFAAAPTPVASFAAFDPVEAPKPPQPQSYTKVYGTDQYGRTVVYWVATQATAREVPAAPATPFLVPPPGRETTPTSAGGAGTNSGTGPPAARGTPTTGARAASLVPGTWSTAGSNC